MARRRRLLAGGVTHHVIQRGNDRRPIFFTDDDRILYLNWLSGAITRHGAQLHAYVLMTNHERRKGARVDLLRPRVPTA